MQRVEAQVNETPSIKTIDLEEFLSWQPAEPGEEAIGPWTTDVEEKT